MIVPIALYPRQHLVVVMFRILAVLVCVVVSDCCFNIHFLLFF